MGKLVFCFLFIAVFASNTLSAQNTRINNYNSIGWFNYFGTFKVSQKYCILLDRNALAALQGRAEDVPVAATYNLSDNFRIRAENHILESYADNDVIILLYFIMLLLAYPIILRNRFCYSTSSGCIYFFGSNFPAASRDDRSNALSRSVRGHQDFILLPFLNENKQ